MSQAVITVTNIQVGTAYLTSFPYRPKRIKYRVPLYRVTVSGVDSSGAKVLAEFDAIRFGVKRTTTAAAKVVGLAQRQNYTLRWSFITTMNEMAWRVYGGFFVHQGPANPITQNWGSIGCIEITGPGKWAEFNALILELTGCSSEEEVSTKGLARIFYQAAARPPLIKV